VLTSLAKTEANDFSWLGEVVADFVKWAPGQPSEGKCGGLGDKGMTTLPCDSPSNFACEEKMYKSEIKAFAIEKKADRFKNDDEAISIS